MSRRLGPEAPRSVHRSHNCSPPPTLLASAHPVVFGPKSVKLPPLLTWRILAEFGPRLPVVCPLLRVKETAFKSWAALLGSACPFEIETEMVPSPTVKFA